jgi:hypothetical protein
MKIMSNFIRIFACYLFLDSPTWALNLNTDPALELWLKLDENDDDSSSNGLSTSTAGGVTWTSTGRLGGAVVLAGDDDRVIVSHDAVLSSAQITVAVWIKPVEWDTDLTSVVSKQLDSQPDYEAFDFRRVVGSDAIQAAIAVGGTNYTANSSASIADGAWQHVAFTYNGDVFLVYHNGDAGSPNNSPTGDLTAATVDLWVGGNPSISGRYFDGKVDDVRLYSGAISAAEVLRLYDMRIQPVRAAACVDEVTAELSRRHNDLNVLCLSGDLLSSRSTERLVEIWMDAQFEGGRHERRVEKIRDLEKEAHMEKH